MTLQSSTETSRTAILHEEVLQDSSSSNSSSNYSSNPTRAHYTTIQRILHPESNSTYRRQRALRVLQSSSRNSTHRRQGDLLEMHPCVLQDIQGNSSCSRDIPDIPVIHDLPAFQAILQCSSISRESTPFQHSPIRMHILQFDWFPENSTEYQLGNYRHYKHSFILQRKGDVAISVKMSRCQDDIFPRIELIPSFVLSSDNTNCKNDIQLFHQLFDELSVHTDYH